jgi:hypothetical protein
MLAAVVLATAKSTFAVAGCKSAAAADIRGPHCSMNRDYCCSRKTGRSNAVPLNIPNGYFLSQPTLGGPSDWC